MKIITLPGTGCLERITEKKHETVWKYGRLERIVRLEWYLNSIST